MAPSLHLVAPPRKDAPSGKGVKARGKSAAASQKKGKAKTKAKAKAETKTKAGPSAAALRWARFKEKSWRVHLTVPGILFPAVRVRWAEFRYRTFSPFAIELVCFDLRRRHPHVVTHPLFTDPAPVQDAVDRRIVAGYAPGRERQFGLIDRLLQRDAEVLAAPVKPIPPMAAAREHVYFPKRLQPLIEERWRELGYDSLSAYVTGLIRYDLMLGGPHKYFDGKDTDPELLAKLDAMTEEAFRANRRPRILLDYLIERALGRSLTEEERRAEMQRLAQRVRAASTVGRDRSR